MSNLIKRLLISAAALSLGMVAIHASIPTSSLGDAPMGDDHFNYIENEKLKSNLYAQEEDERLLDPDLFIEIKEEDERVASNESFELYLDASTIGFKVKNLETDYVWATTMEDPDAGTYDGLLSSGVGIEYINKEQSMRLNENIGITETEFTVDKTSIEDGVRLDISIGGYCSTRNCSRLYDDYLDGVYTLEQMIAFGLTEINASFSLEVRLNGSGIEAHVPYASVHEEESDWVTLSSIILFPALGATTLDETPGYMVVPDGAGALIRYEDNEGRFGSPYNERFYGPDIGLSTTASRLTSYPLSMPIFGAVHGVEQNAFIGIIESGDINARLLAYPNGAANLDHNLIFPKFTLRETYRQSFTSDGTGGARRVAETLASDITVQYNFLKGDDANYTGIGRNYRNHLENEGILKNGPSVEGDIPIHFQYLMSDSVNRFIGKSVVQMSDAEAVETMYLELMAQGITNQRVSLMGWNDGGYSGNLPSRVNFERSLGRTRDFESLLELINRDNQAYLLNDYVYAGGDARNISYRRDVAQGVDRFQIEWTCEHCVHKNSYLLYPETSLRLSSRHAESYQDLNTGVLFENLGSTVFSYYDSGTYLREDTLEHYKTIMETYAGHGAYMYPNAYAYPYTDEFFHAPLFNSQLKYFDDLVPLLQIVLRGNMEVYGQFMNFNSLGREQTLMMIDFGMNPAYILSDARSSELRGTDIERYYSTHYDRWNESIIEDYLYINDALKHVKGETIEVRTVLETGVVETTYSNGVSIVINYTSKPYTHDGSEIQPLDYLLGGVS